MDAGGVERELVRRDFVSLHVVGVRMAIRTRFCNVQWIDRRLRIVPWMNIVRRVTIGADCDTCIPFG